jgi:glycosyltransferase involved in cell wall biosynthesis
MAIIEETPMVTVIVCAYQSGESILPTISSILGQTYKNFQLLIIDDASGDDTPDIIGKIPDSRLLLVENRENLGVVASRNKGLSMAKGRFIAHCDHDDIWATEKLEKQVAFLSSNPEYGLVGTNITRTIHGVIEHHSASILRSCHYLRWSLLLDSTFAHSAIMYRADTVSKHHLSYRPEFTFADDWDFFLQISKVAKIASIPESLVIYRLHDHNWSNRATGIMQANGRTLFFNEINHWLNRNVSKEDTNAYFDTIVTGIPAKSSECLLRSGKLSYELCAAFIDQVQPSDTDIASIHALSSNHWWRAVCKFADKNGARTLRIFYEPKTPSWNRRSKTHVVLQYLKSYVKAML